MRDFTKALVNGALLLWTMVPGNPVQAMVRFQSLDLANALK